MQRKIGEGRRGRISVSLDPEDIKWIRRFKGTSDSATVAMIIKAARKKGLTLDEVAAEGMLDDFVQWLSRKRKSKLAAELAELLRDYMSQ